jgi:hypothetical protein
MPAVQDARKRLGVSEFFELPVPARGHIDLADATRQRKLDSKEVQIRSTSFLGL